MSALWNMGPSAAAFGLRALGFSPRQADRLIALKLRYQRGEFHELTDADQRLRFARWLVQHGLLSDWPGTQPHDEGRKAA